MCLNLRLTNIDMRFLEFKNQVEECMVDKVGERIACKWQLEIIEYSRKEKSGLGAEFQDYLGQVGCVSAF